MKYFAIITALALSACGPSGPVGSGNTSGGISIPKPPKVGGVTPRPSPPMGGQVNACTRSDCGWQSFHPDVSPK